MEPHPAAAPYAALLERCTDVLLRLWFPPALLEPPDPDLRRARVAANSAFDRPAQACARIYRLIDR